jgi:glycosyltransferase involved in cell wall biosynthesis
MNGGIYSTVATHRHAQEIARALDEVGYLKLWHTGWLHIPERSLFSSALDCVGGIAPPLKRALSRKRLTFPYQGNLQMRRLGEWGQALTAKLSGKRLWTDRVWERNEKGLAREAAEYLKMDSFEFYLGFEHGAWEAIHAAKESGVKAGLVFTSPHHSFRKKWVEDLARQQGIPLSFETEELLRRGIERDQRRDEEMRLADFIITNSNLVAQSLVHGGADPQKIISVPLGAEIEGMAPCSLPKKGGPLRFIVSGQVSLRKGAFLLLEAWEKIRPKGATLHLYGGLQPGLPLPNLNGKGVYLYGNRSHEEVKEAYRNSDILIFPTLCDGFGMVVPEAMAAGCAVITTKNAGAADWIKEGENGWVVEAGSVEALAKGIQTALDTGDRLEEMRRNAQETARKNTWQQFRKLFVSKLAKGGILNA